jgi:hypothetical protein
MIPHLPHMEARSNCLRTCEKLVLPLATASRMWLSVTWRQRQTYMVVWLIRAGCDKLMQILTVMRIVVNIICVDVGQKMNMIAVFLHISLIDSYSLST